MSKFYRNTEIKNITEDELQNGLETLGLPDTDNVQFEYVESQTSPLFKNQMAKSVIKMLKKPEKKPEVMPMSFIATGSPNGKKVKGIEDLKRKFEDDEAQIITDLYEKHFKPSSVAEEERVTSLMMRKEDRSNEERDGEYNSESVDSSTWINKDGQRF